MTDLSNRMVDSFALEASPVTPAAIALLQELSVSVGWPHRAEDWQTALALGEGIFLRDEIGRAFGSAMWFPASDDLATIGMVITTPRLQDHGAGRWMMENILARTGSRDLALNATRAAFRLYLALGFVPGQTVYQQQGVARARLPGPATPTVRPLTLDDHDGLRDLDRRAYTAERRAAMDLLLAQSVGIVQEQAGRITGYALCRRFGRGHVVGPVVAGDAASAIALSAPLIARHAGSFVRLDTRETQGPFVDFLEDCGLRRHDTVTSMYLGKPRALAPEAHIFGLANQAIG